MLDAADGYAVRLPGGAVALGGQAVLDVLCAFEAVQRLERANGGGTVPPRVRGLMDTLGRVLADQQRTPLTSTSAASGTTAQPDRPPLPTWEASEWLTVDEAARLLGLGVRRVRVLASEGRLTARKVGGTWQIDRADAERAARERDGSAAA
ncbi:helix-turn-helix domain-containing protein [Geodermatophilus sp. SYSU D00700]